MRNRRNISSNPTENKKLAMGETPVSAPSEDLKDELAEVLRYDAGSNSYTLVTRGSGGNPRQPGGRQLQNIPRKTVNTSDVSPLPIGTIVVVDWGLGFPYISGVLPINASKLRTESNSNDKKTLGGGKESVANPDDNTVGYTNAYYREPGVPRDLLEGDKILITPDGNFVGAFRGGYSAIHGGTNSKARVESFADRDLVRIICENYEVLNGFGTLEVYNSEGRCGLSFRGGSDQLTESGGDEEQWTFKLDIGDPGEYFTMEVCDTSGNTKAKVNITPSGQVNWVATDGYNVANAGRGTSSEEHAGNILKRILGSVTEVIGQNKKVEVGGSRTTAISETDQKTVGHNESTSINNSQILSVGGNQTNTISGGSFIEANPLNVAVSTQVLNGSYFLEVGNPTAGANPAAKAGITLAVNNGDVTLGQNPDFLAPPASISNVNLNTRLPGSVALGGHTSIISTNPALFHAVMFEPLVAILTAIIAAHDTHIHIFPFTPPPVPSSPIIAPMLATMMSLRVLIGG